jgi:hypothetical protein
MLKNFNPAESRMVPILNDDSAPSRARDTNALNMRSQGTPFSQRLTPMPKQRLFDSRRQRGRVTVEEIAGKKLGKEETAQ